MNVRPQLKDYVPNFPSPNREDFNDKLLRKKEYQQYADTNGRQHPIYFNHQMITQVRTGPETPCKSLILYKDTGVGKTWDAIGVAESRHEWLGQFVKDKNVMARLNDSKVLILAQNTTSKDNNFKKDIYGAATAHSYVTEIQKTKTYKTASSRKASETSTISKSYTLETHQRFATMMRSLNKSRMDIAREYSFRVIIIDEFHAFAGKKTQMNEGISKFLASIYGCIIIFMTATPIKDDISTFTSVINLVLDPRKAYEPNLVPDKFDVREGRRISRYVDPGVFRKISNISNIDEMTKQMREYLIPRLRGFVSRKKILDSKMIVRTNEGDNPLIPGSDVRLYVTTIGKSKYGVDHKAINDAYSQALLQDVSGGNDSDSLIKDPNKKGQFYQSTRFVSNMVWPMGLHGEQAHNRFLVLSKGRYYFSREFNADFDKNVEWVRNEVIKTLKTQLEEIKKPQLETAKTYSEEIKFWKNRTNIDLNDEDKNALMIRHQIMDSFRENILTELRSELQIAEGDESEYMAIRDEIKAWESFLDDENLSYEEKLLKWKDMSYDSEIFMIKEQFKFSIQNIQDSIKLRESRLGQPTNPDLQEDIDTLLTVIDAFYSPKMATAITIMLGIEYEDSNEPSGYGYEISPSSDNKECCYGYTHYKPGGVIPAVLLLEKFGYEPFMPADIQYVKNGVLSGLDKGKRYAMLFFDGSQRREASMTNSLEVFNSEANKYGEYVKIALGTDTSAQGINLVNVRQHHLLGPEWNDASRRQTEGRSDRATSQRYFYDDDEIPKYVKYNGEVVPYGYQMRDGKLTEKYIKLFRHVLLFPKQSVSANLRMYQKSHEKYLKSKVILDIMDEVSHDLPLNSSSEELENNRELAERIPVETDYVNYNIFHSRKEISEIKCKVRSLFKYRFRISLDELLPLLPGSHKSTIIKAISQIINQNERVLDRHGSLCYIRENNDVFFLQKMTRTVNSRSEQIMSYYSEHNFIKNNVNIDQIFDTIDNRYALDALKSMKESSGNKTAIENIITGMTNNSKGLLAEMVIKNSELMPDDIKEIFFNKERKSIVYFERNRVFIHVYFLRVRQESETGANQLNLSVPMDSRKELRIFSLDEMEWRFTKKHEDLKYIPLLNNRAGSEFNDLFRKFSHIARLSWAGKKRVMHVKDKTQYVRSQSEYTKGSGTLNKKVNTDGQNINSIQKPKIIDYLWSIHINVKVDIFIGQDDRLIIYNGKFWKSYPESDKIPSDFKVKYRIRKTIGKVYPEMLYFIFHKEIEELDLKEIKHPNFFPEILKFQGILPDRPEYKTVLDLIPVNSNPNAKKTGVIEDKIRSAINESLRSLRDTIIQQISEGVEPDKIVLDTLIEPIPDSINKGNLMTYGSRFSSVWSCGTNRLTLGIILFLLFTLRKSIWIK